MLMGWGALGISPCTREHCASCSQLRSGTYSRHLWHTSGCTQMQYKDTSSHATCLLQTNHAHVIEDAPCKEAQLEGTDTQNVLFCQIVVAEAPASTVLSLIYKPV
jgi:hypothetical protein